MEGKEEIRKRLGRSTDSADAVMLALYPIEPAGQFRIRSLVLKEPEDDWPYEAPPERAIDDGI